MSDLRVGAGSARASDTGGLTKLLHLFSGLQNGDSAAYLIHYREGSSNIGKSSKCTYTH